MTANQTDVEVLVIGAGFGGIYSLHKFRELGMSVRGWEAASGLGGVWRLNSYPGARVDVEMPFYSLDIPEVYETWNWSERFPGYEELRRYFQHVAKVLKLEDLIDFDHEVIEASYSDETNKWTVKSRSGDTATCKYLVTAVGTSFASYTPPFKGVKDFKGDMPHSSHWPAKGVDVKGKKVAIIGSGATGLQIAQEWGKQAAELTVFLRTPNYAIPMFQRKLSADEQIKQKGYYHALFDHCKATANGLPYIRPSTPTTDHTPEERTAYMEKTWERGGFNFSGGLWTDTLRNEQANRIVYDFWVKKVRERMSDSEKAKIFAPDEPPVPYGTKRGSLEQDYYEVMDQPNVKIIQVKKNPIQQFEANGIRTADGELHEFDAIALATGFDAVDGSQKALNLKDRHGKTLTEKWSNGIRTSLGMMVADAPNLFMLYGAQSPCAFTNGPVFLAQQADWVVKMITSAKASQLKCIEPTAQSVEAWREGILKADAGTLFSKADSWYNGANVEGKKKEPLMYILGIQNYMAALNKALDQLNEKKGRGCQVFIGKPEVSLVQQNPVF